MLTPVTGSAAHHRVQFLDAARGSAMFFVLLSHFGFAFFPNQSDPLPTAMRFIGMVASPTFMVLSGLILGFLYRTSPGSFERLLRIYKIKLANDAIAECNGNKTLAAQSLSISRAYLHLLIRPVTVLEPGALESNREHLHLAVSA